jgi:hypothetical protein
MINLKVVGQHMDDDISTFQCPVNQGNEGENLPEYASSQ